MNPRLSIKICGITRPADALAAAHAGADFVGLIFADSPRRVTTAAARTIVAALPPRVQPVALFRDAPLDEIARIVAEVGVRWVQLHGHETADFARALTAAIPDVRIIRAWEATGDGDDAVLLGDLAAARGAEVTFPAVILDAPKHGAHPGFDALAELAALCRAAGLPAWCAGGLTPENVAEILAGGRFDGVDVARGVESQPGVKDPELIARFIRAARGG